MFRPVPKTGFLRTTPYRLITSIILSLAVAVSVVLLFRLEREEPLLRQPGYNLVILTVLLFLMGGIGIAAVIAFLHYDTTKRTLEEVKGLARTTCELSAEGARRWP